MPSRFGGAGASRSTDDGIDDELGNNAADDSSQTRAYGHFPGEVRPPFLELQEVDIHELEARVGFGTHCRDELRELHVLLAERCGTLVDADEQIVIGHLDRFGSLGD